jgi:uncharacterized protein YfaP (DUF2135 family)
VRELLLVLVAIGFSGASWAQENSQIRTSGKPIGKGLEKPVITLHKPDGGWTVDRMVQVSGTVNDPTIDPVTVSINGDRYLLRTRNGEFSRKFPSAAGRNTVTVSGVNQAGATKVSRSFHAEISAPQISLVLTSDTDGIYTDLHIYEPDAESKDPFVEAEKKNSHVYWAETDSPTGGKFYLNEQGESGDQPGYGPYLYTHTSPPAGIYRVDANYWPSGDKPQARATLNLTLFGGTSQEQKRLIQQPLITPGETKTLAFIRWEKGGKSAQVYVPGVDPVPSEKSDWPAWVRQWKKK